MDPEVFRWPQIARLIRVTLIQSVPFILILVLSFFYRQSHHPSWTWNWLWISYSVLFAGELRAWWLPYLVRPEPGRATRYEALFGGTHAFLPRRTAIVPNTPNVALHAATLAPRLTLAAHAVRLSG